MTDMEEFLKECIEMAIRTPGMIPAAIIDQAQRYFDFVAASHKAPPKANPKRTAKISHKQP